MVMNLHWHANRFQIELLPYLAHNFDGLSVAPPMPSSRGTCPSRRPRTAVFLRECTFQDACVGLMKFLLNNTFCMEVSGTLANVSLV
jgi:hypothetical protein